MESLWELIETNAAPRVLLFSDAASGLRAVLAIDDLTLGPAAGGIRTRPYPDALAAADDAMRLARAMTLKCSIAGLDAGGAKMVVLDRPELDRAAAFRCLGHLGRHARSHSSLRTSRGCGSAVGHQVPDRQGRSHRPEFDTSLVQTYTPTRGRPMARRHAASCPAW